MRGLLRRLALFIVDFVENFAQFLGLLDDEYGKTKQHDVTKRS